MIVASLVHLYRLPVVIHEQCNAQDQESLNYVQVLWSIQYRDIGFSIDRDTKTAVLLSSS